MAESEAQDPIPTVQWGREMIIWTLVAMLCLWLVIAFFAFLLFTVWDYWGD